MKDNEVNMTIEGLPQEDRVTVLRTGLEGMKQFDEAVRGESSKLSIFEECGMFPQDYFKESKQMIMLKARRTGMTHLAGTPGLMAQMKNSNLFHYDKFSLNALEGLLNTIATSNTNEPKEYVWDLVGNKESIFENQGKDYFKQAEEKDYFNER